MLALHITYVTQESNLFTGPFAWNVLIDAMQRAASDDPNKLTDRADTESGVPQKVANPQCEVATGGVPEQKISAQNTKLDQRWRILVMTQKKFGEETPLKENMWVAYEVRVREIYWVVIVKLNCLYRTLNIHMD